MSEYTWVPFYKEFAEKLMNYQSRQKELIDFLEYLKIDKNLPVTPYDNDKDENENNIRLREIDPFTFFGVLNRGITEQNRFKIAQEIKTKFAITANIPEDFEGIPVMNSIRSWYFAWQKYRGVNDIPTLWQIAAKSLVGISNISEELFNGCLKLDGVGVAYLTMGLFWLNPDEFAACDKNMISLVSNKSKSKISVKDFKSYLRFLNTLKEIFPNKKYYEISHDAWNEKGEINEPFAIYNDVKDNGKVRYWAGGHHLGGEEDISPELFEKGIWRMVYSSDEEKGKHFYELIKQVAVGDYIILKSFGGKSILSLNGLGKVHDTSKAKEGILGVEWLVKDRFYKGPSPKGDGGGNWWGTLLEVTRQSEIKQFYEDQLLKVEDNKTEIKYWLYSPGIKASRWDEFHSKGIMAIELDALGDLKNYHDKASITSKLQELSEDENPGSKKNDSTAGYEFANKVSIGDVIIVKSKQRELNGYGIVASDYFFDSERSSYKSCRKVDWKLKGTWPTYFNLVQKALTDVTKYKAYHPDYKFHSEELMAILNNTYKPVIKGPEKKEYSLNQILYGPPGTGKTYNSINHALAIIENKMLEELETESEENREFVLKRYRSYVEAGQILFATFHQSMCYEDFIEGIKPIEDDDQLNYELKDGIFKAIAENAFTNYKSSKSQSVKKSFDEVWNNFLKPLNDDEPVKVQMKKSSFEISHVTDKTIFFNKDSGDSKHTLSINTLKAMYNEGSNNIIKGGLQPYYEPLLRELLKGAEQTKKEDLKNFVLIIDEINRGNVSQIFGELITLIEKDKRLGAGEELTVTLPYSKKKGFGVPSNLFIIGTMNTADRSVEALDTALRRRFTFIEMPPNYELSQLETEITEEITLVEILKTLNNRIEKLLDKDHLIGHSYFLNVDDLEGLKDVFQHNIIPLLQEYFYGDFAKIGLVLGEAFFEQETVTNNVRFAKYKHDSIDDLNARSVIKLKRYWKEGDFEQAIKELVNPN